MKKKNLLTKKTYSCWIAIKLIREVQRLGPFYYFQLWFYSWVLICDQMHCMSVYLFFLFGYVEVPKEMECDTPREWGTQRASEIEKARSSKISHFNTELCQSRGPQSFEHEFESVQMCAVCVCVHKGAVLLPFVGRIREFSHFWDWL